MGIRLRFIQFEGFWLLFLTMLMAVVRFRTTGLESVIFGCIPMLLIGVPLLAGAREETLRILLALRPVLRP